jgi:hypothetical protein
MQAESFPERYWHCYVKMGKQEQGTVVNDLTFADLKREVIDPWLSGRPFTISGLVIRSTDDVQEIKIAHTSLPQETYAQQHEMQMRKAGSTDFATNRRYLPLIEGRDCTFELLFSGEEKKHSAPREVDIVEQVCQRVGKAAQILCNRSRKNKTSYVIDDEYDVQDLLQALLRGYFKFSVQENPLPKVAGAKSGRADISVEELGVLIEVKYVRGPDDQKKLLDEFSQDLILYAQWIPLKILFYVIYNSADLRDPEALEKLSGDSEINGKRFQVRVILT